MSLNASNLNREYPVKPQPPRQERRIGDILVADGQLDAGDLFKALVRQQHEDLHLGEMLQGLGYADESSVIAALSEQSALPVIDLDAEPPANFLGRLIAPEIGIRNGFLLWKQMDDTLVVAISDPMQMGNVTDALAEISQSLQFVLASREAILRYYQSAFSEPLSEAANLRCPKQLSTRGWSGRKPKIIGWFLLITLITGATIAPTFVMAGLLGWILIALIANSSFKLMTLISFWRGRNIAPPSARAEKLPKISILVPLLHESDILDRLVERMSALVYPKELLEICLVYEASDTETKKHLAARHLPYWMRSIEIPENRLQTKPRALNYAMDFCRGDIIGVYDAEDAPEPDQLYRVASSFENAADDVACVQCRLDYYNSETNWLSRCFTIEYAILFRVVLPGLQRMGLPIPLGGTSVFFKRDKLEALGRWDAHNVTEDADLGMRLHRQGMRCICAPATTYEEANYRMVPWVKQRSRWLKGFLQTWITHMRHPLDLWRSLGPLGFVVFHVLFLGTFTSFAAAPLVLPLWVFTFGVELPIYQTVSPLFLNALVTAFVATEILLLVLGLVALRQRGEPRLIKFLPMMLFYWPIGSFAAYKALYELFARPAYWDKTQHGINDREYQAEIDRLTAVRE